MCNLNKSLNRLKHDMYEQLNIRHHEIQTADMLGGMRKENINNTDLMISNSPNGGGGGTVKLSAAGKAGAWITLSKSSGLLSFVFGGTAFS